MLISDFVTEVRMGATQLNAPTKKSYTIGFEFEFAYNSSASRLAMDKRLEKKLIEVFGSGTQVVRRSVAKRFPKSSAVWTIEPDESITPEGMELVSPVYQDVNTGISEMQKVLEIARIWDDDPSIFTNSSTGFHVNIGTWNEDDWDKVDLLKFLMFIGDRSLKDFDRQANFYTVSNIKQVQNLLFYQRYQDYQAAIADINRFIRTRREKYSLVNLNHLSKSGYIEIRAMGNAGYENNGDLIEQHIRIFLRALDIASDPTAYRNEYLKKLTKLFNENPRDNPDDRKLMLRRERDSAFYDAVDTIGQLVRLVGLQQKITNQKLEAAIRSHGQFSYMHNLIIDLLEDGVDLDEHFDSTVKNEFLKVMARKKEANTPNLQKMIDELRNLIPTLNIPPTGRKTAWIFVNRILR